MSGNIRFTSVSKRHLYFKREVRSSAAFLYGLPGLCRCLDMSGSVLFLVCAAVLLPAAAAAADATLYSKVSGDLDLHPSLKPATITAVSWKHNEDIVAQWVDPTVELEFWGVLKGRATMDKTTGVLSITNMTGETAGRYTVEVNSHLQMDGYLVMVLKEVAVPEVVARPLVCSAALHNCNLSCVGDTAGAEPVTIFWRRGEEDWKEEGHTIQIFNAVEARPKTFTCRMKNPVSSQDSLPFPDPFATDDDVPVGAIVGPVVTIALLAVVAGVFYAYRNREPVSGWLARFRRGPSAESRNGTEVRSPTDPPSQPMLTP